MTLIAVRKPFDIDKLSGPRWAEMLALPDPGTNGARRVADALNWLEQAKLVTL